MHSGVVVGTVCLADLLEQVAIIGDHSSTDGAHLDCAHPIKSAS
jgi:hypothetical protein